MPRAQKGIDPEAFAAIAAIARAQMHVRRLEQLISEDRTEANLRLEAVEWATLLDLAREQVKRVPMHEDDEPPPTPPRTRKSAKAPAAGNSGQTTMGV